MKSLFSILIIATILGCSSSSSNFELCGGKLHPYYHPELKYEGGFYAIKNTYYTHYDSINAPNNTGIVRIRFHVNCNGNTGNFEVETYNFKFQKNTINNQITDQLLQLTQGLNGWIPAVDEDGETVNSHKFLSFRIANGKLIDILPK